MNVRVLAFSAVVLGILGCGSDQKKACVAGKADACACPGGGQGVQLCKADGSAYEACDCTGAGGGSGGGNGAIVCGATGAPSCGSHGACVNSATGATCACQTGYAGLACNQCDTGYQDHDGDGSCLPTCASLSLSCSNHGTCSDATGAATCTCAAGYAGSTCSSCATGFQDNDGNGSCVPACASASCSNHGVCADSTGAAVCTCSTGYTGTSCSSCATGYQDNDQNGDCQPACGASSCSGHGTCADSTGTTVCTCGTGYTGTSCSSCATGYQDNNVDSVCSPTCATSGLSCGGRAQCDDGSGTATCACLAGYTGAAQPDGGTACSWTGVVLDPGLQGTPANAWVLDGGVEWDAGAPAGLDPGYMLMAGAARCAATSLVSQPALTLPAATVPDHLALQVNARSAGAAAAQLFRLGASTSSLLYNNTNWQNYTMCLGEGAYGRTSELVARTLEYGRTCSTGDQAWFDHLEIAPSASCPALGTVTNGDFEDPSGAGWSLNAYAAIVPGGSVNGTHALRLAPTNACYVSVATTTLSVPLATTLANPALHFTVVGTAGKAIDLYSDNGFLQRVNTTGLSQAATACLGSWAAGNVVGLTIQTPALYGSTSCGADSRQFDVDNVTLVSDSACAMPLNPYNPGFETNDLGMGWLSIIDLGGWPDGLTSGVDSSAVFAHSGNGYLRSTATRICMSGQVTHTIRIPDSVGSSGPALKFWYRTTAIANSIPSVTVRSTVGPYNYATQTLVAATSGWSQQTLCLPPQYQGVKALLQLSHFGGYGGCVTTYAAESVYLDDVQLTTDPGCPPGP